MENTITQQFKIQRKLATVEKQSEFQKDYNYKNNGLIIPAFVKHAIRFFHNSFTSQMQT